LHDVSPNYLVMEYIEGPTLAGPLPLAEALFIARQIAEALMAVEVKTAAKLKKRFLISTTGNEYSASAPFHVVLNWKPGRL
jgi:serine/threonine protein kinase